MIYVIYFILIAVAIILVNKFLRKFKFPKLTAISVFTGGVKVGKTGVSLACALSHYRSIHRSWKIRCVFIRLFNKFRKVKKELPEEPLFYSNIKLATIKYCDLTHDHILRKKRFNFKSVVFIDEASLLADSQLFRIPDLNIKLMLFFKLFGHETHGGYAVFNSQQISDLHVSLRRCTAQYFYIHSCSRYIPFVTVCNMREERFSEDGTTVNNYQEDVENTMRKVLFRKSTFKKYDYCCYSSLTDSLEVLNIEHFNDKDSDLKSEKLISFRPEFNSIYDKEKPVETEKVFLSIEDLDKYYKGELENGKRVS